MKTKFVTTSDPITQARFSTHYLVCLCAKSQLGNKT